MENFCRSSITQQSTLGDHMSAYSDMLKAALEKKKQQQGQGKKGSKADTESGPVKDQVASHKPAKKSAGRGR